MDLEQLANIVKRKIALKKKDGVEAIEQRGNLCVSLFGKRKVESGCTERKTKTHNRRSFKVKAGLLRK